MDNEKNLQPVNVHLVQANYGQDEVSLIDVWRILINYKYHVVSITLTGILVAFIYGLVASPVYQAKAYLLPPHERDIVDLQLKTLSYSTVQVYKEFVNNLNSRAVRLMFFNENNLISNFVEEQKSKIDVERIFDNKFHQSMVIEKSSDNLNKNMMVVEFSTAKAEIAAEWLNRFIVFTNNFTVNSLKQNISKKITRNKQDLKLHIDNLRITAKKMKADEITRLTDALLTAKKIGMEERYASSVLRKDSVIEPGAEPIEDKSTNFMFNLRKGPLYSRGIDALSAEIEVIAQRKNLDSFIPKLRKLEEEISILDAELELLENNLDIRSVIVDQNALVPNSPIKPKRNQLMLIGFFVGLFAGVITAFILNLIRKINI